MNEKQNAYTKDVFDSCVKSVLGEFFCNNGIYFQKTFFGVDIPVEFKLSLIKKDSSKAEKNFFKMSYTLPIMVGSGNDIDIKKAVNRVNALTEPRYGPCCKINEKTLKLDFVFYGNEQCAFSEYGENGLADYNLESIKNALCDTIKYAAPPDISIYVRMNTLFQEALEYYHVQYVENLLLSSSNLVKKEKYDRLAVLKAEHKEIQAFSQKVMQELQVHNLGDRDKMSENFEIFMQ